ncbi:LacI family DNA-binding transcriptional regulator [Anaerosporobacter faecicola]|uniref:LacI family DNA-binding transcriptional regulator n=1 Tax=Anaerosporobacter faecicola TaxID=2718714 RepID=UPI0014390232|nr:LacI family DNA-binding transcriptional regulator [Anaerosporobacter faecicola]
MATLKDVAAKSGVTVTTVSRVLNNRGYISEETREKVYAAMKELNYQPNEIARSLSKQKSNSIGIIVPHIEHPYFAKLIGCLEREAAKRDYKIMLCNSHAKFEKEIDYLEMFQSHRVAGIILCSSSVDIGKFISLNIPVVSIERPVDVGTTSVECDNYLGGVLAAEHLIACGCKNLVHISGIENEAMPADARCQGFVKVCEERQISHWEVECKEDNYLYMEYHALIEQILTKNPEVDGIFASSDLIAAQVIQVASKMNRLVPKDLRIVGFDDVNIASLACPAITTIHQPIKEMAKEAIECLIKCVDDTMVPSRIQLPVSLVKRETT